MATVKEKDEAAAYVEEAESICMTRKDIDENLTRHISSIKQDAEWAEFHVRL